MIYYLVCFFYLFWTDYITLDCFSAEVAWPVINYICRVLTYLKAVEKINRGWDVTCSSLMFLGKRKYKNVWIINNTGRYSPMVLKCSYPPGCSMQWAEWLYSSQMSWWWHLSSITQEIMNRFNGINLMRMQSEEHLLGEKQYIANQCIIMRRTKLNWMK